MTIKDPLETETARLLPSTRGTGPRTFFWDFTPSWRYILAILLAFVVLFTFSDRTMLALSISPIFASNQQHFHALLSVSYGYIPMSLVGGRASQIYGGKDVLIWGVLVWSLTSMFTPLCYNSLPLLIVFRALIGLSEGLIYPAVFHLLSTWFPDPERTQAVCMTMSGVDLGMLATLMLRGFYFDRWGLKSLWASHFYVFGALGTLLLSLVFKFASSSPEWHPQISLPEVQHITKERSIPIGLATKQKTSIKWRLLLSHPSLLAIYCIHALTSLVWSLTVIWLPNYLAGRFSMDVQDMVIFALLPFAAAVSTSVAGGVLCDMLIKQGFSRRKVRCAVTVVGIMLPALGFQFLPLAQTPAVALAIVTPTVAAFSFGPKAGYLANILDVAPNHAGLVVAMAGIIASIPSIIVMNLLAQHVTDIQDFEVPVVDWLMNASGGLLLLVGALIFIAASSDEVIYC